MTDRDWHVLGKANRCGLIYECLLEKTRAIDEHPEDYNGPCLCQMCMSYADLPEGCE